MAVPSLPISGDKVMLRRRAREARKAFVAGLDAEERGRLEQKLAEVLQPLLDSCRILGLYAPLPDEISPVPAAEHARANGAALAYPAFADHQSPFRFLAGAPSQNGPFGILQPSADSMEVLPDMVLVPLVAIDRQGNRLGQGKGHYDRVVPALRRSGALLVGVGWPVQRIDETIVTDPWDVPLDGFASPDGLEMRR